MPAIPHWQHHPVARLPRPAFQGHTLGLGAQFGIGGAGGTFEFSEVGHRPSHAYQRYEQALAIVAD